MKIFTVLGLAIFLFVVMIIISVFMNIAILETEDEAFNCFGFIFVMIILSILLSLLLTLPEKIGYEKITSNDSVEEEVGE